MSPEQAEMSALGPASVPRRVLRPPINWLHFTRPCAGRSQGALHAKDAAQLRSPRVTGIWFNGAMRPHRRGRLFATLKELAMIIAPIVMEDLVVMVPLVSIVADD